ncbi:hypothetical protein B566_EDAN004227 [Ephemera danica]|nr:hypothetical protein B566_EDAN004227 [Ephemera danica]
MCLLMVLVMCRAVPMSMVRSVRLHHDCSHSELQVDLQGKVNTNANASNQFNNLTFHSKSFNRLAIFAEKSQRYLCYNKAWRLVGSKKYRGERCEFEETMIENGYNRYRSVANRNFFVGFNTKGEPIKGPRTVATPGKRGKRIERCTWFLKRDDLSRNIIEHNKGDEPAHMRLPPIFKPPAVLSVHDIFTDIQLKKKNKRKKVPSERLIDVSPPPPPPPSAVQVVQVPKHAHRHSKNKNHLRNS